MTNPPFLKCKDYTVSGREFELRYDKKRDMLVTFPQPDIDKLPEFYKSEKYISHTDSHHSFFDKMYQWVKSYMLNKKLKWIEREKKEKGNLLDIGAGTADFLVAAKKKAWQIHGSEPNSSARKLASEKDVFLEEDTSVFSSNSIDVITMWHVLEHVPDLEIQIKELQRLLKENGLLVIAVPNFKSYDAKKYKEFWAAYDVPRHLWHFSRNSISPIFQPHGFELIKTKGLPFDSFYVSLLSEKNKNNQSNFFSGFWNGFLSNLKAKTTKEYSSVVYFLQKR